MYYRITDWNRWPYWEGYNTKSLEDLSRALWNLWYHFRRENDITQFELLYWLKEWATDFLWYYVEKSKEPFDEKDLDFNQ